MARRLARHGIERDYWPFAPLANQVKLYTETAYSGHGQILMLRFYFWILGELAGLSGLHRDPVSSRLIITGCLSRKNQLYSVRRHQRLFRSDEQGLRT